VTRPLRTVIDGLRFPEGPRWRRDRLWFSDIHSHRVIAIDAQGAILETIEIEDRPSGLGFLSDGSVLISSILDRRVLRARDGVVGIHADVSHLCRDFINDMVVDKRGNAYVGARNGAPFGSAGDALILVRADGSTALAAADMTSPNGPAVTPDGEHLIVAETALGQLTRFRIREDGSLTDRAVMARRPGRMIDGMCLDAAGNVWCGGGTSVYLLSPDSEVRDEIETPGRGALAVALGGPDGRTLFIATSAPSLHDNIQRVGSDRTLDAATEAGGRIEAIDVAVPGVEAP
jgi:sugar lactone lactonase YvrE